MEDQYDLQTLTQDQWDAAATPVEWSSADWLDGVHDAARTAPRAQAATVLTFDDGGSRRRTFLIS